MQRQDLNKKWKAKELKFLKSVKINEIVKIQLSDDSIQILEDQT